VALHSANERALALPRNPPFSPPAKPLSGGLKKRPKSLFIQQLECCHFALCAAPLSWHK